MSSIVDIIQEFEKEKVESKLNSLIDLSYTFWNPNKPEEKLIIFYLAVIQNINQYETVQSNTIDNLTNIVIDILNPKYFKQGIIQSLINSINSTLDKPIGQINPKSIVNLLILIKAFFAKTHEKSEADKRNNLYLREELLINLQSTLNIIYKLPKIQNDIGIMLNYLKLIEEILGKLRVWEKVYNFKYYAIDVWKENEENIIKLVLTQDKENRLKSGKLLHLYGRKSGEIELQKAIFNEKEPHCRNILMEAITQVGFVESRFVLMYVMQKGSKEEKAAAENALNKLAKKFCFHDGNEMVEELKPKKITLSDTMLILGTIFSLIGIIATSISLAFTLENVAVVFIIIASITGLGFLPFLIIPIINKVQNSKYKKKLEKWDIDFSR